MKRYPLVISIVTLLLAGCRGDEPKRVPDTLPDVRGQISGMERTATGEDNAVTTILVESVEGIESDYPKASIKADKSTLIEDNDGQELQIEALREGQQVEVWIEGAMMETSPVQGKAAAIRITDQ